ncbi:MAG: DUF4349 domain-containing protein [Fimbriimonadales bacterium]
MNPRDHLKAYLDRELPEDQAAAVRQALESDPELRQELEQMRILGLEIRRAAVDPEPEGMEETLQRIGVPKTIWTRRPLLALSGIAAVAILIAVATTVRRNLGAETAEIRPDEAAVAMKGSEAPAASLPAREMPSESGALAFSGEADLAARMVVRTADIRLKVEDAAEATRRASEIARSLGGYVASSGVTRETQGRPPEGTATLRVPEKRFEEAMDRLRSLGEVLSESSNSDDVTLQHADVSARLKVLRAEEQQYVTLLGAAKTIGQVLQVRERLNQVRQQIESLDAQKKALERQAALSTITATFIQRAAVGEPKAGEGWAAEAWASAVNGLAAAFRWIGAALIFLFVYAPLWLPLLLVVVFLARRLK